MKHKLFNKMQKKNVVKIFPETQNLNRKLITQPNLNTVIQIELYNSKVKLGFIRD